jgi:hypothetical protein
MTGRRKERCLARVAVAVALVGGACPACMSASPVSGASGIDFPIVFTQLPVWPELERQPGPGGGTLRCDYGESGRIVRLDPDGTLRVLTEGFESACGADISFDGERILFAGKRRSDDPWNIWEMGADGTGLRQITRDCGNCRSPAFQATLYTIVSTEPWYQIMFVSDRAGEMNEYGSGPAQSLYSCKLDGSAVRRLTMNLSDDFDPFLMSDGRVLLASWQRRDLRRGPLGRVAIFGVNTDGADYALYCGDPGRRVKHMPCETTDGLVVFVEADSVGFDGAGQLAAVSVRRPLYSYKPITQDERVLYHSPSPLPDGAVLVSSRPAGRPVPQADENRTHGLYRLVPRTSEKSLVFDDPAFHDVHARLLAPRPQPDGRSSVVNEKYPTGKLYCLNVYLTDPDIVKHMSPGMVRGLRVIEGVPVSADDPGADSDESSTRGFGGPVSVHGMAPIVQKRLLGQVPVEADGSFHIEIPADVPVELQTLDAHGMALRSCGWIWAKHREPRGCIGCHEDPELTPENRFVLAMQRPGMKLTLPPDKRRAVDFRRHVMPIIERKCVSCHDGENGGPDLRAERCGDFNRAYESLLAGLGRPAPDDRPAVGKYVHPGQARTSPLIWRLFGRNTSRPWDVTYNPGPTFPTHPPAEAEQLTDDERLTFIEWIDLGAHWDGINE